MLVPQLNIQHSVGGVIDTHASSLLTLLACSKQPGAIVPLLDGADGVRGTKEYYQAVAADITSYAQHNPDQCEKFLAELFLPSAEKMNMQRQSVLANS